MMINVNKLKKQHLLRKPKLWERGTSADLAAVLRGRIAAPIPQEIRDEIFARWEAAGLLDGISGHSDSFGVVSSRGISDNDYPFTHEYEFSISLHLYGSQRFSAIMNDCVILSRTTTTEFNAYLRRSEVYVTISLETDQPNVRDAIEQFLADYSITSTTRIRQKN